MTTRVLTVDNSLVDVHLIQELLADVLGDALSTVVVHTLAHRIAAARLGAHDVTLLDLMLPDAHGLETLKELLTGAPSVPVVVLPGITEDRLGFECLLAGAQDFVSKTELGSKYLERALRYAKERAGLQDTLGGTVALLALELNARRAVDLPHRRILRALRALASCHDAIHGHEDPKAVAAAFCRAAAGEEGYAMVWVGLKDRAQMRVRLVAAAGAANTGADEIHVMWDKSPLGQAPSDTVLQTGRPVVARDMARAQAFVPWWRTALDHGFRSSAALPLRWGREVVGVLGAYHAEIEAFDEDEVGLLALVADVLSVCLRMAHTTVALADAEARVRQSERLSEMGQLAGGVAHDFNNLLQIILGHSERLLAESELAPSARDRIRQISSTTVRAADLTRQLLAFSRRQVLESKVVDLNRIIQRILKMVTRLLEAHIRIETRLAGDLWPVRVDPSQMAQVILNLAVNARDAMPLGGMLTFETANVELDETYSQAHKGMVPAGPYVMLAVTDTGAGMDAETQARIFEPFFTTKEQGKGTGLGLATVYAIVIQSCGYICVHSEPGKGTTFKIYLPRTEGRPGTDAAAQPQLVLAPTTAPPTVLVVEDEPGVRSAVKEALVAERFLVLEASGPGDALLIVERYGPDIDLVLTDVGMPHMSGPELLRRIRDRVPGMKALYMTGHTQNGVYHQRILDAGAHLIHKPFSRQALAQKVWALVKENP